MFELWLFTVLLLFIQGIQHVSLKNIFVSHRGQDENNCGNWTLPCCSVRHAVNISSDNDVIYIDYAEGKPYKECEHPEEKHTIMLNKSLSFYGLNGRAILHCEKTYPFFGSILTPKILKIVFSNLSLASRGTSFLASYGSIIFGKFDMEFNFCNIESSSSFFLAVALWCSIQVLNCNVRSYGSPLMMVCGNLTTRLIGSTFFSCPIELFSNSTYFSSQGSFLPYETALNVHINNSSFIPKERKESCDLLLLIHTVTGICNVTITSSIFMNFDHHAKNPRLGALAIKGDSTSLLSASIVLDKLHFENIMSHLCVVLLQLEIKQCNFSLLNSKFINTTKAFISIVQLCAVTFYNVTFNSTNAFFGSRGLMDILGHSYYFSSCQFFQNAPAPDVDFPLIHTGCSTKVTFENCLYEINPIAKTSRNSNLLTSKKFYLLFYDNSFTTATDDEQRFVVKEHLTMRCPPGYAMNLNTQCGTDCANIIVRYWLFTAFCEQCPPKTYSFDKGTLQNHKSNHITCQNCPIGGNCVEGQVTSKPNFWGYKSNQTATFLQCPPKYCCNTDHCETYHSCYGNRMGTLCGKCPIGMSESLFHTKCKANKDCTSVIFWPSVSAYLIFYLLFFLYQKEIMNFVQKRFIPRIFLSSRHGRKSKSGGLLKIIFYYYQIVYLLRYTFRSDVKIQLLDDIENFLSKSFNFLIINIPSIDCPFQDLRPVQKAIIVQSVGYTLLTLLCLLYLSVFVFKMFKKLSVRSTRAMVAVTETMDHSPNLEENGFSARITGAFTNISLLMYASSAHLCLSLLHCVPLGNKHVLFLDGNVKCYQSFQYFFLAYMVSSIVPFCLVPVLGSYLLKSGRIGVKQFCSACIFPLPFCCFWMYLLLKDCRYKNQETYNTIEENDNAAVSSEQGNDERQSLDGENIIFTSTDSNETLSTKSELVILNVLLGPFRPHQAFKCFPSSHIPWEGFLIFRRLVLITVLTFVYDIQLKLFLALILCVAILLFHMFVYPFQRKSYNVLEAFSLGAHVVLCGLTLTKALYYGEGSSLSKRLPALNVIEKILTVAPLSIIMIVVLGCIAMKLVSGLKLCLVVLTRNARRIVRFTL